MRGVAKAFGPRLLFRDVHLRVAPGTVSLLVGANGAGKSTLMRIMAGLARPDAGDVACGVAPEKLGYLGHATFLYPGLTARENLLFWARAAGLPLHVPHAPQGRRAENNENRKNKTTVSSDAVDQALRTVGLSRHAHDRAGVFSRGMAQRLNLARLLLFQADLLLLDEPGTGLDTASRGLLRTAVESARARGAAVVWISHDQVGDSDLADRVLRLENRTLLEERPLPYARSGAGAAGSAPC